jgi:hypothetical protein
VNQPQVQPSQNQTYNQTQQLTVAPVNRPVQNGGENHCNSSYKSLERERESTIGNEEGSVTLIESLPKGKQRQVFSLISGLQGGIEHLQRELEALKKALGIDDEN